MISDGMFMKLKESGFSFDTKPTFEELWERLPTSIENDKYSLFMQKSGYTRIYYSVNCYSKFVKHVKHNDRCNKSLSDLAAEMLIELKNRGMIE